MRKDKLAYRNKVGNAKSILKEEVVTLGDLLNMGIKIILTLPAIGEFI